ncbi:MAG: type I methionyl aminopeptidase, partial [Candidatus Moranbacteria bacterium]|nr:type I methionyl aminopeptidase [Candidatus Moranbacteria bacterium]
MIKSKKEIEIMRQGGKILRKTLKKLKEVSKTGVEYSYINDLCAKLLKKENAKPAAYGYNGFPGNLCISRNDEIVHGIPFKKIIQDGDLLTYDLIIEYKGMFTDSSISFVCGEKNKTKEKIIEICRQCLDIGIGKAKIGNRIGDIGSAIQKHAEKKGYSVVRNLVGHGVGYSIHEDISVPNYGRKGTGKKLKEGMTLA